MGLKGETPDEVRADLAVNGHGWVVPRDSGAVVSCGGLGMCGQCKLDRRRLLEAEHRVALSETGQGEGRR